MRHDFFSATAITVILDTALLLDTKGREHDNFQYLGFFFFVSKYRYYVAMFHKYNGKNLSSIGLGSNVFMGF